MFVELNYKKRGERRKGGGEEKKKRRARERYDRGKGRRGKRKEAMIWRKPPFSSTSNDATCLPAIIFAPLTVIEPWTVNDILPPIPLTRTTAQPPLLRLSWLDPHHR